MAVTPAQIKKGIVRVLFNQFFVSLPLGYTFALFSESANVHRPMLPSIGEIILHFAVFIVIEEICFYYSHRLMVNRTLDQKDLSYCCLRSDIIHLISITPLSTREFTRFIIRLLLPLPFLLNMLTQSNKSSPTLVPFSLARS